MRYSRFKKQMEGTSPARRPRSTASTSPRKNKVEKNRTPKKIRDSKPGDEAGKIKGEVGEEVGSSQETIDTAPDAAVFGLGLGLSMDHVTSDPLVKREPGMRSGDMLGGSQYPLTPGDSHAQSETPSPGFGGAGDMSDMDEMIASFGMPGQSMYDHPVSMADPNHHGYSMGMHMGMGDPYEGGMWQQSQATHNNGVPVKSEPRWDENYPNRQA